MSLSAKTHMVAVCLRVRDLALCTKFYVDAIGLEKLADGAERVLLGAGGEVLVELEQDREAQRAPNRPGLFHLALLLPSARALGAWLAHIQLAGWPLQGAADHGVSKAIYLSDPEGNGIEVYCDRARGRWPFVAGQLRMGTEQLDVQKLLDLAEGPWQGMPADTRMGHVHLCVSDLEASEQFYCEVLGFDLMQRYGDEALFVAAGGYHHHLGLNIWRSRGAAPAPDGAAGLVHCRIVLPDMPSVEALRARLAAAMVEVKEEGAALYFRDPAGNALLLHPLPAAAFAL